MVPWIQVYSNILTHPKTYALAEQLKIPNYAAVGLMVSLWTWASLNAPDGDISEYPQRAIAEATGWGKNPQEFYKMLLEVRLIEKRAEGVYIRNWERYASLLIDYAEDQKEKTNERVRKHREKKKSKCNVTVTLPSEEVPEPGNVTDMPCNAPTLPNLTVPNKESGSSARVRELPLTEADKQVQALSDDYQQNGGVANTAVHDSIRFYLEQGLSPDVIREAIRRSALGNKRWPYIDGILRNWHCAGYRTLAQVKSERERHGETVAKASSIGREKSFAELAAELEAKRDSD